MRFLYKGWVVNVFDSEVYKGRDVVEFMRIYCINKIFYFTHQEGETGKTATQVEQIMKSGRLQSISVEFHRIDT